MDDYRCRFCDTVVPRGHRMQYCQCGQVFVDWGSGGKGTTVRVGWPDGHPDEWIETIDKEDHP
jgi:hypothetical protein